MKPTYIGFSRKPYAIIFWRKDGEAVNKTVCYDNQELDHALARHNTPGDFYNTLEPSVHLAEEVAAELSA